jgi:hypothetical protein
MKILSKDYYLILIILKLFFVISDTSIVDTFKKYSQNYINSVNKDVDKNSYNFKNKCEIRITTNGICSLNNQIIKPQIIVQYSSSDKYGLCTKVFLIFFNKRFNSVFQ